MMDQSNSILHKSSNKLDPKKSITNEKLTKYHQKGNISKVTNYKRGLQEGKQIEYYLNGKQRTIWKEILQGNLDEYYENGFIKKKMCYWNGKLYGIYVDYYENG